VDEWEVVVLAVVAGELPKEEARTIIEKRRPSSSSHDEA
jgi:hypothetical protein